MKCEQFKQAYQKFDGADNVIHWKDLETAEYGAYSDHMQDCHECRDWFQTRQLETWKVDATKFPCIHMAYQANYQCGSHQNPWECPSTLIAYIEQFDEYGIPIRDGTESYWKIDNCPWCGTSLPEPRRDQWIMKLKALGYDPFGDYEKIPAEYKTGRWYKDGHIPRLRLV